MKNQIHNEITMAPQPDWLKFKLLTIPRTGKDVEQQELPYSVDGSVKSYNHFGKSFDGIC